MSLFVLGFFMRINTYSFFLPAAFPCFLFTLESGRNQYIIDSSDKLSKILNSLKILCYLLSRVVRKDRCFHRSVDIGIIEEYHSTVLNLDKNENSPNQCWIELN